jgi:hypothetical protein
MAVLLLIGRRAARDFAADDPVFVRVARHRPLRVCIERGLSCLIKSDRGVAAPIDVRRKCVVLVCYLQDLPANLKIFH